MKRAVSVWLDRAMPGRTLVLIGAIASLTLRGAPSNQAGGPIDFSRDIRPLLNDHCLACHGGVKQAGKLSFIYRDRVFGKTKSGAVAVVPGKPDASELIARVTAKDEDERMPPADHGPRLAPAEIQRLRDWIQQGAVWEEHWAFVPPKPQALPEVRNPGWCRDPLDYFILARLEQEKLDPAPEASRRQWLRRVTFDLIGLPPAMEDSAAFLADQGPGAYERVVDRLLHSQRFGERWASVWLDLARYADSQGYEKDSLRTMWPYRDWLIRAFNADMPFDQFTIRQLAGDQLAHPTLDDLIATAFHRNTPANSEGGTDDEEFRVTAVIDRVSTTWEVWQGLTFKCAQCHSHPYDPIENRDYYRFMALFNTSKDWDLRSDEPKLHVPLDRSKFRKARDLDRRLRQMRTEEHKEVATLREVPDQWRPLAPESADSTGETELFIVPAGGAAAEVVTQGTVSHDSRFTITFKAPEGGTRLTALRVEVLPRDPDKARYTPELGFVISQLRAQVLGQPGRSERAAKKDARKPDDPLPGEIRFVAAFGDEVEPFQDAQATLDPDKAGWGALPRIMHRRVLVLVPGQPVDLAAGKRLRLIIRQEAAPHDLTPLVMNRSRYSFSQDPAWTRYIEDPGFGERRAAIARIRAERSAMKDALLPVMFEQDAPLRRGTAVFKRGNWLDKTDPVEAGVPRILRRESARPIRNRLELARWLVSPDNPLTARVAVNRFWAQCFGTGIVETLGDFGSSGQPPSHPRLLDFLAWRFQNQLAWDVKRLLREFVLSATYRQDTRTTEIPRARDPRNRWLARGPRLRLTAEMVRDNAMAVSGLLSDKMFGPPVMPVQPDGIWRAARSSLKWKTSEGEDRYRRAIYTFWRRSSPYPSMMTFDTPNRLVCSTRRMVTNTPLQALVTMDDPVYLKCAAALAERMKSEGGPGLENEIAYGYARATGEPIQKKDLEDLSRLYRGALAEFSDKPGLATALGAAPGGAALVLVANTLLNLDRVLTR